jgi:hypothetical protein
MRSRGRPCMRGCWAASARTGGSGRTHPSVCADALVSARTRVRPCRRIVASARMLLRVRADAVFTESADGKNPSADKNRVRGVYADAGGRPDDVRERPDGNFPPKSSFMTSLLSAKKEVQKGTDCVIFLEKKFRV